MVRRIYRTKNLRADYLRAVFFYRIIVAEKSRENVGRACYETYLYIIYYIIYV